MLPYHFKGVINHGREDPPVGGVDYGVLLDLLQHAQMTLDDREMVLENLLKWSRFGQFSDQLCARVAHYPQLRTS